MIDKSRDPITEKLSDIEAVAQAMRRGVGRAMREHKLMGRSVVVRQDGKMIKLPPEEIPDYDEDGNLIAPPDADAAPDGAAKE